MSHSSPNMVVYGFSGPQQLGLSRFIQSRHTSTAMKEKKMPTCEAFLPHPNPKGREGRQDTAIPTPPQLEYFFNTIQKRCRKMASAPAVMDRARPGKLRIPASRGIHVFWYGSVALDN